LIFQAKLQIRNFKLRQIANYMS